MKILLTGAEGFTGRHFTAAAQAAGCEVVPLKADLTHRIQLKAAVEGLAFDAVVHLAAISFVGHADDKAFYDVNLFGTLNLLEALQGRALDCVLVASSANVYGDNENSPIAESEVPAPKNHYAMSKLAMEHMARTKGLPLVLARPFNYTGPGQALHFVIPKLVDHFRRRAPEVMLGNLDVEREYNDVRMVCESYLRLLQARPAGQTVNVCTGQAYGLREVIALLSSITGHALSVEVDPKLVRSNEIRRLCGSPARLQSIVGDLPPYTLRQTLEWMLESV